MNTLALSNHAHTRMAQRALRPSDLELILAVGSEVENGILVCQKDVEQLEQYLRSVLKRLEKVRGKRLVIADGCLITAYHAPHPRRDRLRKRRH